MKIQSFVKQSKLKRARAETTGDERMNVRVDGRAVRVDGRVNGRARVKVCVGVYVTARTRTGVRAHVHLHAQLYTYRNGQVFVPDS